MNLRKISTFFIGVALLVGMTPNAVFAEAICDVFTVTPTSALPGDFVTFDWSTTNTVGVNIDALGARATSGSELFEVPNTPGLISYNLEALDSNLSEPNNAFCSADLTILGPAVCNYFTATPDNLDGAGDVTLDWSTSDADIAVTIDNGVGSVSENGSIVVPVTTDTTFTLTADGTYGSTQCSVPVTVNGTNPSGGGSSSSGGKSINPSCDVEVSTTSVKAGDTVSLSWTAKNTEELQITTNQSGQTQTMFSTTSPTAIANGLLPVVVTKDTTFTVAVKRPNRSAACATSVTVVPDNLLGAGIAGATGLIALTDVPETGFDPSVGFLIILNLFLAFGAALGAYVLVVFTQHYKRATDRSFTVTHTYTPVQVLFLQERRFLQSRIILWKWCALALPLVALVLFILR
jgi:hypothetical protein